MGEATFKVVHGQPNGIDFQGLNQQSQELTRTAIGLRNAVLQPGMGAALAFLQPEDPARQPSDHAI